MNELIDFIAEYLNIDPESINEDTDFQSDLGLSSFDLMDLSCEIEEQFETKIETEDLANIRSVKDLSDFIEQRGDG